MEGRGRKVIWTVVGVLVVVLLVVLIKKGPPNSRVVTPSPPLPLAHLSWLARCGG